MTSFNHPSLMTMLITMTTMIMTTMAIKTKIIYSIMISAAVQVTALPQFVSHAVNIMSIGHMHINKCLPTINILEKPSIRNSMVSLNVSNFVIFTLIFYVQVEYAINTETTFPWTPLLLLANPTMGLMTGLHTRVGSSSNSPTSYIAATKCQHLISIVC